MSYLNKEQLTTTDERKSVDEIALAEVDNYIEKVEGSTERTISDSQNQQFHTAGVQQQSTIGQKKVLVVDGKQSKTEKILLPIDEKLMSLGLRSRPTLGIKWLAEWCLMMIKKYPGRVFYSPVSNYD